jgi:hypothetical protein
MPTATIVAHQLFLNCAELLTFSTVSHPITVDNSAFHSNPVNNCNGDSATIAPTEEGWGCKGGEVRLVAWSIRVTLSDKGAQSTQINPSRSDGSGVP